MECNFDVMLQLSPEQKPVFEQLLALEAGKNDEINTQFVALATQVGGQAAGKAADEFVKILAESHDSLYPHRHDERNGYAVWNHTFGSSGQDFAELIANLLAAFQPPLTGIVEGDYDEDPYGFRYSFERGTVSFEEGFLMDEWEEE